MENNGRYYCTVNTWHINLRHFFVIYRANKVDIEIKHCPTHLIIAEYFTKEPQGKISNVFVI